MKKSKIISVLLSLILVSSCSGKSQNGFYKSYETPDYKIIQKSDNIEIRQYEDTIVAQVEASGSREEAVKDGFRTLAGYIFGKNISNKKVAMTSPVTQKVESQKIAITSPVTQKVESQKIAMTSPVSQTDLGNQKWLVQFTMPKKLTLDTLPTPKDQRISLKKITGKKLLVISFSGSWSDKKFLENIDQVKNYAKNNKLKVKGEPILAYYDDPFTFPWNRRNEVMLEIATGKK